MVSTIDMNKKDFEKKMEEAQQLHQLKMMESNRTRAQSVSIGMSGSGTTEITMRGDDGSFLWNVYQPVQVTEFIHQLAASIGCHIQLVPREDFGSWRDWGKPDEKELAHINGFPPFAVENKPAEKIGLLKKEIPPGTRAAVIAKEKQNVATKKAVNKRSTKRTRSPSK